MGRKREGKRRGGRMRRRRSRRRKRRKMTMKLMIGVTMAGLVMVVTVIGLLLPLLIVFHFLKVSDFDGSYQHARLFFLSLHFLPSWSHKKVNCILILVTEVQFDCTKRIGISSTCLHIKRAKVMGGRARDSTLEMCKTS